MLVFIASISSVFIGYFDESIYVCELKTIDEETDSKCILSFAHRKSKVGLILAMTVSGMALFLALALSGAVYFKATNNDWDTRKADGTAVGIAVVLVTGLFFLMLYVGSYILLVNTIFCTTMLLFMPNGYWFRGTGEEAMYLKVTGEEQRLT